VGGFSMRQCSRMASAACTAGSGWSET
jgi:hypothetical protein